MRAVKKKNIFKNLLYFLSYVFLLTTAASCIFGDSNPEVIEEGLVFCVDDELEEMEPEDHDSFDFDDLFAGGHGTEEDPYQICTVEQLQNMNADPYLLDKFFVLIGNVDASATGDFEGADFGPEGFIPIGDCAGYCSTSEIDPFIGSLNGNGFTIFGLTIRSDKFGIGLFAVVDSGAVISDLRIEEAEISVTSGFSPEHSIYVTLGALAGYVLNTGHVYSQNTGEPTPKIDRIHVDYSYIGSFNLSYAGETPFSEVVAAGGVIGATFYVDTTFTQLSSRAVISASRYAGGIVAGAFSNYMTLSRVSSRSVIYGGRYAGGIIGKEQTFSYESSIEDAYVAGTGFDFYSDYGTPSGVIYADKAGGAIGFSRVPIIKRFYLGDDVVVTGGSGASASGIVGYDGLGLNTESYTRVGIKNSFSAGQIYSPEGYHSGVINYGNNTTFTDTYGDYISNNFFLDRLFSPPASDNFECGFNFPAGYGTTVEGICEEWTIDDSVIDTEAGELFGLEGFFSSSHDVYDVIVDGPEKWEFGDGKPWMELDGTGLPKLNFD